MGESLNFNWKIELCDSDSTEVYQLRKLICSEIAGKEFDMSDKLSNKSFREKYLSVYGEDTEDLYRFSDYKWNRNLWNGCEVAFYNNDPFSVSCFKKYGNSLRVGSHLYCLKTHRAKFRNLMYLPGGFFEKHLNHAISNNCDVIFLTFYCHNRKTKLLFDIHKHKRSEVSGKLSKYFDDLIRFDGGPVEFNGVLQEIFYLPLKEGICFEKSDIGSKLLHR